MNRNIINEIEKLSKRPKLFEKGTGNIWTEPYISTQMLKAHLDYKSDRASRNIEKVKKTVTFLKETTNKGEGILDLGCGPGLYAEEFCRNGYKVTGIDFSSNSINYAKESANKQGLNIEYRCEDMFNINYNEKYDTVIQVFGEVNTFSDENRNKLFDKVKNALKPGGLFIFDVSTPVHRRKNGLNKNWYVSDCGFWRGEAHIVFEEGFEYSDNIWLDQFIVIDNEEIKVYRNWFHEYTLNTIKEIVLENGFSKVNVLNGLYSKEVEEDSEWLTVIAAK
ncbi:class I SAM-dependent methyltransferase [Clostridium paridis]|nr:class I SAM-dependent methyltransferase [Clostridium paridis]